MGTIKELSAYVGLVEAGSFHGVGKLFGEGDTQKNVKPTFIYTRESFNYALDLYLNFIGKLNKWFNLQLSKSSMR